MNRFCMPKWEGEAPSEPVRPQTGKTILPHGESWMFRYVIWTEPGPLIYFRHSLQMLRFLLRNGVEDSSRRGTRSEPSVEKRRPSGDHEPTAKQVGRGGVNRSAYEGEIELDLYEYPRSFVSPSTLSIPFET